MALFDGYAVPALPDRTLDDILAVVTSRRDLLYAFEKPTGIRNVLELSGGEKETEV